MGFAWGQAGCLWSLGRQGAACHIYMADSVLHGTHTHLGIWYMAMFSFCGRHQGKLLPVFTCQWQAQCWGLDVSMEEDTRMMIPIYLGICSLHSSFISLALYHNRGKETDMCGSFYLLMGNTEHQRHAQTSQVTQQRD